jgi:hypothetical protein
VRARPGDVLDLEIVLTPSDGGEDVISEMQVVVPNRARRDGEIQIAGGRSGYGFDLCIYEPDLCTDDEGGKIDSLEKLIAYLENQPRNNDLRSELRLGGRRIRSFDAESLDRVVSGRRRVRVRIAGGRGDGGEAIPEGH